jgi:hypothetical protein
MIFKKPKGNQNKMKPRGRKRKLAASAILSLRLLFGEPQLASSNSKTFQSGGNSKTEISRTLGQESSMIANLNQDDSIQHNQNSFRKAFSVLFPSGEIIGSIPRGGDINEPGKPSKFGPGSKARGAARRDFARRQAGKNSPSRQSGGGLFADAFTVEPKFPARPGGNGLSGRFTPQPTPDPHNPGTSVCNSFIRST